MKKITKIVLLIMAISLLTVALCACKGDKNGGNVSKITIGIPQDIDDSLDPAKMTAAGTREVLFNVFEGLVKPDPKGDLVPAVASDVKISEDGKTYIFTLREGVKFHDGTPVTPDDVIYSIDRCRGKDGEKGLIEAYGNIASIEKSGDNQIAIALKEADTEFLAYMTTGIVPKSNTALDTKPIGTGPYKFVSRSPQQSIVMQSFDDYWGEKAKIKDVTFKICANPDSIVMDLQGGSVDMYARVTSEQAAQLSDKFRVYEGTMNLVQALYLNNEVAPFNDERVRKALSYAVSPQGVMDIISDGKGTIIGSSMFPTFGKYFVPELADTYKQDVEKAKALLKEAGYGNGFEMSITVPSNYTPHVDTAQVLVEQFKAIGVKATINLVEWNSWLSDVYQGRKYQSTVIGVDASVLTARALLERFTSGNSGNFINYKNQAYDETFAKALSSVKDDEKTKYYKECQKILTDTAANVYIQDLPEFVVLNKKFDGYQFYPLYVQDIARLYPVQ